MVLDRMFGALTVPREKLPCFWQEKADTGARTGSTNKLLARLAEGDADAETLRVHAGLSSTRLVWGLLKYHLDSGRVTRVANSFHLVADWKRQRHPNPEVAAAIELVEAHGFRVTKPRKSNG